MGTFTLATGLGMLLTGIVAMAIGGIIFLWITNRKGDDDGFEK
jgi:hypothetical protein